MSTTSRFHRRTLLKSGLALTAMGGLTACSPASEGPSGLPVDSSATPGTEKEEKIMSIVLPPLPYDVAALEPHLTRENLELHHGKHHQAYVTNLNKFIEQGQADGSKSLEQIIMSSEGPVFNNAAQVWNHTFFWHCMKPGGGGAPAGELAQAIARDFGSFERLSEEFTNAAVSLFGSGWAWLVLDKGKLQVVKTANADLPMKHGQKALLTCDVWEHAYYPTYKNVRPKYVEVFLRNLVNWEFAAANLKG